MAKESSNHEIREQVGQRYAAIVEDTGRSCCDDAISKGSLGRGEASRKLGYSEAELQAVPAASNLGLGCGNPGAIAALKPGETVLDLGCGAGFDCFLAARQVGETGRVIGVDMTTAMLKQARDNAGKHDFTNMEFRLGEIEALPAGDDTVDVIISNCVINLSPEKHKVFEESFRVLKPGGRLAVADMVSKESLPEAIRQDPEKYCGCIGGAATLDNVKAMLTNAGFVDINIELNESSKQFVKDWLPESGAENYVVSANIQAVKPADKNKTKQRSIKVDEKTKELIAIGASVAAHCQPCLTFHVNRAAGLCIDEKEIQQAVKIGEAVNEGATAAIKRHGREVIASRERPACCTGGSAAGEQTETEKTPESPCCGAGESKKKSGGCC